MWVLIYSILLTLLMVSWAYVPERSGDQGGDLMLRIRFNKRPNDHCRLSGPDSL
jgi:hypothetical protein